MSEVHEDPSGGHRQPSTRDRLVASGGRAGAWLLLCFAAIGVLQWASAQSAVSADTSWSSLSALEDEAPLVERGETDRGTSLHYVAGTSAMLYNRSDSAAPVARVPLRTPLHRHDCSDGWCRVRTDQGRTGYVPASVISNVWIRVSKQKRRIYLYRGTRLVESFDADVSYNAFADKMRRGSEDRPHHWRIPEGTFYVVRKNPASEFYKALVLNYPTVQDAERGLKQGLISPGEHQAIVEAQAARRMPPMGTALGGWIEIHGEGTGDGTAWTQGCVAVRNQDMNTLWPRVEVGTPVVIE